MKRTNILLKFKQTCSNFLNLTRLDDYCLVPCTHLRSNFTKEELMSNSTFFSTETNLVEAVCNGAKQAGKSVGALVLMVIAFISLYYFVDSTVAWLGSRAGLETTLSVRIMFLLSTVFVGS